MLCAEGRESLPSFPQGAPVSFKTKPKLLVHSPPFLCAWVEEQTTLQVRWRGSPPPSPSGSHQVAPLSLSLNSNSGRQRAGSG